MKSFFHRSIELLRPAARRLPEIIKRPLRRWISSSTHLSVTPDSRLQSDYSKRMAAETAIFSDQVEVHDLPPIFHYWSNRWLRPQLERFGFSNPDQFFALYLEKSMADARVEQRPARFASLGCGNADTEVRIARLLMERGSTDFVIECLDINPTMLERGRALASEAGVAINIRPLLGDFNAWQPSGRYDAVMANQSLHHVVNLEGLFAAIESALTPNGRFVTSDMIGRNGHRRWPEALAIVEQFWAELPSSYRYNLQLRRQEDRFMDWDCSVAGFEGIRSQDVLPLLVERFDFEFSFAYGNVIDPFIDRGFGPHFDAAAAWDREFIDRVHLRDEAEILAGRITPTHLMAVMHKPPYFDLTSLNPLPPKACIRR